MRQYTKSIKVPPVPIARVLRVHTRPYRRRMQRQLNGVYEQIVIPPVLTVVVRPVVDDLPDDLLDSPSYTVERPVEAAFHGQSVLGAVAATARWELAVKQRA